MADLDLDSYEPWYQHTTSRCRDECLGRIMCRRWTLTARRVESKRNVGRWVETWVSSRHCYTDVLLVTAVLHGTEYRTAWITS